MSEMVDRVLDVMQSRGLMADEADASAIFNALRDPTNWMIHAAAQIETPHPITVWRAMIDAALKEWTDAAR